MKRHRVDRPVRRSSSVTVALLLCLALPSCADRAGPGLEVPLDELGGSGNRVGASYSGSALPILFSGHGSSHGRVVLVDGRTAKVMVLPELPLDGGWLADADSLPFATRDWVVVLASVCPTAPVASDTGDSCRPDPQVEERVLVLRRLADHPRWRSYPRSSYVASFRPSGFGQDSGPDIGPVEVQASADRVVVTAAGSPPPAPGVVPCGPSITVDPASIPLTAQMADRAEGSTSMVPLPPVASAWFGPTARRGQPCRGTDRFLVLPGDLEPRHGPDPTANSSPRTTTASGPARTDSLLLDLDRPDRPPEVVHETVDLRSRRGRWILVGARTLYIGGVDGRLARTVDFSRPGDAVYAEDAGVVLVSHGSDNEITSIRAVLFDR